MSILLYKKEVSSLVPLHQLHTHTGSLFCPYLQFEHQTLLQKIAKKMQSLHKEGEFSAEPLWLGSYFQKEFTDPNLPQVSIRWIDDEMGWGLFAEIAFQPMEFIAEYTGIVRQRRSADQTNAYCFEYLLAPGHDTSYVVDAQDQGGLARYINHSDHPNLASAQAVFDNISHIVLYTKTFVAKGEQLCYDYGADYWKYRKKRRIIH